MKTVCQLLSSQILLLKVSDISEKMTLNLIDTHILHFKLVKGISCLCPNILFASSSCVKKMEMASATFEDCQQMMKVTAREMKSEFCNFIASFHVKKGIVEFNHEN